MTKKKESEDIFCLPSDEGSGLYLAVRYFCRQNQTCSTRHESRCLEVCNIENSQNTRNAPVDDFSHDRLLSLQLSLASVLP